MQARRGSMTIDEQYGLLSPARSPLSNDPRGLVALRTPDSRVSLDVASSRGFQPSPEQPGPTFPSTDPELRQGYWCSVEMTNDAQEYSSVDVSAISPELPFSVDNSRSQNVR